MTTYTEFLLLKSLIKENLYLTNKILSVLEKHEDIGYAINSVQSQNERLYKILDILEGRNV